MLAVSARVGQRLHIQRPDGAVLIRADAHGHAHLVAGGAVGLALLTGEAQAGGAAGLHGNKSGVHLAHGALLCAEAAADAGLDDPDVGLAHLQRVGQNAPHMEGHLGGGDQREPAVLIQIAEGDEGLHHGLVVGLGVEGPLDDHRAGGQLGLHVAVLHAVGAAQVALVVRAHGAQGLEVLFRMHQNRVVLRLGEVQQGLQHLVFYFNEARGLGGGSLGLGGHQSHRVAHAAQAAVQDQPVVGAGLRVGLARGGEAALGYIFIGKDGHNAGHFQGGGGVDLLDQRVGVGAAQHLHHQGVGGDHVAGVDRLAGHKAHGVHLADGLIHVFHSALPSFAASQARMARSWLW